MASENKILFYNQKDPYYEFSNYYMRNKAFLFVIDENEWLSTEHYYQAMKFVHDNSTREDLEYAELIRTTNTSNKARILGNQKGKGGYASKWYHSNNDKTTLNSIIISYKDIVSINPNWDEDRVDIMRVAIETKFEQNEDLMDLLLSTENNEIHEHTNRDKFWGDCGEDMLGKMLMEIREKFI
jgi:predicted NAD-dependent protein-ADP-ribosyltransferase YbiA (DUF1768 family)